MEVARRDIGSPFGLRQFAPPRSEARRVSRCLFGPSSHVDSVTFAKNEIMNQRNTDKKRWNFDFENEKPLPGKYDWEKVSSVEEVRKRPLAEVQQNEEPAPKELRLEATISSAQISVEAVVTVPAPSSPKTLPPASKKTKISDYFHAAKRNQQQKKAEPSGNTPPVPESSCV